MLDGIKTDHNCPECDSKLQFDAEPSHSDAGITVNIYCENDDCDYYTWVHVDPIAKEIY
jgi:hypothetical protein